MPLLFPLDQLSLLLGFTRVLVPYLIDISIEFRLEFEYPPLGLNFVLKKALLHIHKFLSLEIDFSLVHFLELVDVAGLSIFDDFKQPLTLLLLLQFLHWDLHKFRVGEGQFLSVVIPALLDSILVVMPFLL